MLHAGGDACNSGPDDAANLRRNESLFATLVDQSPFGLYVVDSQFRLQRVNRGAQAVFSTVRPLIGRDFAEILRILWPQPFADEAIERFRHTLATGEPYDAPPVTERRNDVDVEESYDWRLERITLPDGQYGVVCYFYDLTRQKAVERALRESEERYRTLFNSIDEGFCVIEMIFDDEGEATDYRFLETNPGFEKQSGLADTLGRRMRELAPDHEAHWFQIYGRVAQTGESIRFENCAQALNRWFDVYAFRIGPAELRRVAVLFTDITPRKLIEETVRRRTAQVEALVNDAPMGVYLVDADFRLREVNPTALPVFGDIPELIGSDFREVVRRLWPQPFADDALARFRHTLETGEPFIVPELREVRADRGVVEHYHWEIHRIPLPEGGFGVVCYFRDISRYVQARDALRESERQLQQANSQLELRVAERTRELLENQRRLQRLTVEVTRAEQAERRRLATLLHDGLQQLLVAAKMRLEQARLKSVSDAVKAPLDACSQLIGESITASRSLTAQLSPPVLHDAGLAPALSWLARWMRDKHEVTVELSADPAAEPESEDVRLMLFEATRELLFNVAKHAGVHDAAVTMLPEGEDQVRIIIHDRGRGFDPQTLENEAERHGIGLLHTRERLRYIGGNMSIRSTPGQGTQVELVAPRMLAPETDPDAGAEGAGAQGAELPNLSHVQHDGEARAIRVLVADDHQIMREGLVSLLLEDPDMQVVGQAADGEAAVELAHTLQPDVVVMDVTMPGMNGIEATRQITRRHPKMRVIGLSMHAEHDLARSMRDAGAAAYLTKGGPSEALLSAIKVKA